MVVLSREMHGLMKSNNVWLTFLWAPLTETMFVKSSDGSKFVNTWKKPFDMFDTLVEGIGEENVVYYR